MSCKPVELPPLTAAEQALLDKHELAVQRAGLDLASAVAADPLLAPFAQPIAELDAALDTEGQAVPASLHALLGREELAALLWSVHQLAHPDAVAAVDARAALKAPHSAPVWSLLEARRLEMAGRPEAADQAIRQYLGRAAESGRLSARSRQLAFRWLGLTYRHPEPASPLPERTTGCWSGLFEVAEAFMLAVAHDFEAMLAWGLVADAELLKNGQLCALPWPGENADAGREGESGYAMEAVQVRSAERLQLCTRLHQELRQHTQLLVAALQDNDAGASEGWQHDCKEMIRTASAAPDWRTQLDRLALTGCPVPKPADD